VHKNKTKKDDNECWLLVIFSRYIEIKQKTIITSVGSLSSFKINEQNIRRWWWIGGLSSSCANTKKIINDNESSTCCHCLQLMEKNIRRWWRARDLLSFSTINEIRRRQRRAPNSLSVFFSIHYQKMTMNHEFVVIFSFFFISCRRQWQAFRLIVVLLCFLYYVQKMMTCWGFVIVFSLFH